MDSRQVTAAHYEREIIKRVKERNDQLSRIEPTPPSQKGTTLKFRRYDPLPPCTEPYTEGKPYPKNIELKYHDVEITEEETRRIQERLQSLGELISELWEARMLKAKQKLMEEVNMTPAEARRLQSRLQALEEQITELSQGVLELQRDKAKAKIAEKKQEYAAPQVKAKTKGKATK
jgi:DNA repair exonuclease SbcCD ATPase subunit